MRQWSTMWSGCALCNCRDNPSNPRSPFKIIGDINATIDTAMGHVDRLIDKVSCQAVSQYDPSTQADRAMGVQCALINALMRS